MDCGKKAGKIQATTQPYPGFSDYSSLSVTGLPPGAEEFFDPALGKSAYTSNLTITTSGNTPEGVYAINITGVGGGNTHVQRFELSVSAPVTEVMPLMTITLATICIWIFSRSKMVENQWR